MKQLLTLLFSFAVLAGYSHAQFDPFAEDSTPKKTEASLIAEVTSTAAGETFTVAIKLKHAEGWHAYYKNPGGPGLPLEFDWKLPDGYQLQKLHWPTPHLYTNSETQFYVYENEYYFLADITTPAIAKAGDTAQISVTPSWQLCDEKGCDSPVSETLTLDVPVAEAIAVAPNKADLFKQARAAIPSKSSPWEVTVEVTSEDIIFTLKTKDGSFTKLKSAHYIDDSGASDPEKKQTLTETDNGYTLQAPRAEDSAIQGDLTGILITGDHEAYILNTTPTGNVPAAGTGSSAKKEKGKHSVATATEEDKEAAALLYDVKAKVPYVLLDGSKEESINLLTAVGLITLGGLLLNLMPCVFPVLGLKIMGFVQQAGEDSRKIKLHGLTFATGVIVSMWVLAAAIYALKYIWKVEFDWGDQLAYAPFLAAMILVLFIFGLNMAGVFELGTSLTGVGGELQTKKGYSGSFFSGVLTTLIATPCTGPFLGVVLGYTLAQPVITGMMLFTAFAIGISIPYIGLSFFPKLIKKLPRPGAWMVTFKSIMAFALFASAGYFFKSFASQTGTEGAWWFLMAIIVISLGLWAYGNWGTQATKKGKRYFWGYTFPIALVVLGIFMTKDATEERPTLGAVASASHDDVTIHQWYPGIVEQNRAKGRIIWLDYTAEW